MLTIPTRGEIGVVLGADSFQMSGQPVAHGFEIIVRRSLRPFASRWWISRRSRPRS
jgi:hypothetical protein